MAGDGLQVIGEEDAPAWAIRLEAKLDVALAQHGAQIEGHDKRIGVVEDTVRRIEDDPRVDPKVITDHEARIRTQEGRSTVSPRTLAATVAGVLGTVGALSPLVERLYS